MESYLTPDSMERLDEVQILPITRVDVVKEPVPVYNDNYMIGNMVYSSSLAILKAAKDILEPLFKTTVDNSIQFVVLTMAQDRASDYFLIRKASMRKAENNRILLPSVAISLIDYRYIYSSPYNNDRYKQYIESDSRNLLSFLSIPMFYNMSIRYYCTNWDLALRFEDNLIQNGNNSMPKDGFAYEVKGINDTPLIIHGTLQILTENKGHTLSKLSISDKRGDVNSSIWYIDIPMTIRASIISRPYLVPSVQSSKININMNGKDYHSFEVLP